MSHYHQDYIIITKQRVTNQSQDFVENKNNIGTGTAAHLHPTAHFPKRMIILLLFFIFQIIASRSQEIDEDDLLLSMELFDADFLHQELTSTPIVPDFDHPEINANSKPCVMGKQASERDMNQAQAWKMPTPTMGSRL